MTNYSASIVYNGIIYYKNDIRSVRFSNGNCTRITDEGEILTKKKSTARNLGLAKVGCLGSASNTAAEQSPPSPSQPHVTRNTNRLFSLNRKEIARRIYSWYHTSDCSKHLYFVTISFPLKLSDNLAYKYFNTWLTKLRKEEEINNYIWVAERQENGTIHFHILVSNYVKIREYNDLMKECLLNGLNKKEFAYSRDKINTYNGVDLAKDKKTKKVVNLSKGGNFKNVAKYITKYVTKNTTEMQRQTWHCSRLLSNLVTKVNITILELSKIGNLVGNNHEPLFENDYIKFFPFATEEKNIYHKLMFEVNQVIEQCAQLTAPTEMELSYSEN